MYSLAEKQRAIAAARAIPVEQYPELLPRLQLLDATAWLILLGNESRVILGVQLRELGRAFPSVLAAFPVHVQTDVGSCMVLADALVRDIEARFPLQARLWEY